jgi:hypothetical protein
LNVAGAAFTSFDAFTDACAAAAAAEVRAKAAVLLHV